jgi:hypothetical protein
MALLLVGALAAGCQKSPGLFEGEPAQEGTNGRDEPGGQAPGGSDPYGGTNGYGGGGHDPGAMGGMHGSDAPVQKLKQDVQQLRQGESFAHTDLVNAIRDLGSALRALPSGDTKLQDAASRVDGFADRIEAVGSAGNTHGKWAKQALGEAVKAIDDWQKAQGSTALADRIEPITQMVDAIPGDGSFMQNKMAFVNAYEQIADAIGVAWQAGQQPDGTR